MLEDPTGDRTDSRPEPQPGDAARPFGTFTFDVQTRTMIWSDSIYSIYGFEVGTVVPSIELFSAHQHPDDRAVWQDGFRHVLRTGEPFCRKFRIVTAKRVVRTVMTTGQGALDQTGEVVAVQGFLVDLTETLREYHADEVTRAVLHSAETRPLIEQAKGVLMASFDLDDAQAFKLLRLHSSYANVKLREVAANLVERLTDPTLVELPPRQRVAAILAALADGRGPVLPVPVAPLPREVIERAARPEFTIRRLPAADLPRTLVHAVADAAQSITIADFLAPDHPLVYVNAAFEQLTGYVADDILGRNCRFLQGADTEPAQVAAINRALSRGEEVRTVLRNYRQDGTPFWNELNLSGVRDETGRLTHYIGYQLDVSERVEREQQLFQLAYFDGLTGLPNQANAILQLDTAPTEPQVELLHIAVGGFRFPDESGSDEEAAAVLSGVARVMRAILPADAVVAKLDTDAFLSFHAGGDWQQTVDLIKSALSGPVTTSLGDRRVAVSVGHACRPRDAKTAAELIAQAAYNATELA